MIPLVVDTSLFIRAERGEAQAIDRIERLLTESWSIASVTLYELTCSSALTDELRQFYEDLFGFATVYSVTREAAEAAAFASSLRRAPLKAPDALIAGVALERGARVVTADSGFLRIPGLDVELVLPS
ncbi:MAG: type II toxin-antitoxin system VapC family toxin [Myxococcaceae bacterium]